MNTIRALAAVALLVVGSIVVFGQCCPGDGACPATQGPTLAVVTTADILEQAIVSTDAAGQAVATKFAEVNKRGEKLLTETETEIDADKLPSLQEKYMRIVALLRYSANQVVLARFESEFLEDDSEFLDATRNVLKGQKALNRANTLVDELGVAVDALSPKVAEAQPVEDNDA